MNAIVHARLLTAALTFLIAVLSTTHAADARRPNIVFVLSDDHAAQAISCYGGKLMKTPHIDRLATGGMRFDRCFCTESICGPSRAAILTGKYGHVTGAMGWKLYDRRHRTFPEYLCAAGYQTALIGKYHQGINPPGFDYYDIFPGQGRHVDPEFISKDGKRVIRGHSSDVITDLGLAWLEKRDPNRPFLLCLHDKSTHMPWVPAQRFEKLFENETLPEPPTLHDDFRQRASVAKLSTLLIDNINAWQEKLWGAVPDQLTVTQRRSWLYQQYIKHYLRCAAGLDENIGRVLDYLDRNGLTQDTIVIYASDQGFFLGEHRWFDKRWMLEESLRLPFIIRYPRLVKAGAHSDALALNVDFAPTLLDLAGMPVPVDMQGRSLRPCFAGERPTDWRKAIYYRLYANEYSIAPHYGIRAERHKLIHYKGIVPLTQAPKPTSQRFIEVDEWELFDLQTDPDELVNIYNKPEYQDVVAELKTQLERLRQELKDKN
jgi:arylsulfatase A-like enzyme